MIVFHRKLYHRLYDHQRCTKLTHQVNGFVKYITFIYYYLFIPGIDATIISLIYEPVVFYRTAIVVITLLIVLNMLYVNHLLVRIGVEAHASYAFLHSLLARHHNALGLSLRYKTDQHLEKLTGRVIGIYCWNLFPFTNWEFFLLLANCALQFTLVLDIITSK